MTTGGELPIGEYILCLIKLRNSIFLLQKPIVAQLVKTFTVFYGTRNFIPSLSGSVSLRSSLILFSHLHLGLPSWLFPSRLRKNFVYAIFYMFRACYMSISRPTNTIWFGCNCPILPRSCLQDQCYGLSRHRPYFLQLTATFQRKSVLTR
jgi:hypothetical protein